MKKEDLKKIADTIAESIMAKKAPLPGCGDASSSSDYTCPTNYECWNGYECGGAGTFMCAIYLCDTGFYCYSAFQCSSFSCGGGYNP